MKGAGESSMKEDFCLNTENFLVVTAVQRLRSCFWKVVSILSPETFKYGPFGIEQGSQHWKGICTKRKTDPWVSTKEVNKIVLDTFHLPQQILDPSCSVSWKERQPPQMTSPGSLDLWLSFTLGHWPVLRSDQRVARASRMHPW